MVWNHSCTWILLCKRSRQEFASPHTRSSRSNTFCVSCYRLLYRSRHFVGIYTAGINFKESLKELECCAQKKSMRVHLLPTVKLQAEVPACLVILLSEGTVVHRKISSDRQAPRIWFAATIAAQPTRRSHSMSKVWIVPAVIMQDQVRPIWNSFRLSD